MSVGKNMRRGQGRRRKHWQTSSGPCAKRRITATKKLQQANRDRALALQPSSLPPRPQQHINPKRDQTLTFCRRKASRQKLQRGVQPLPLHLVLWQQLTANSSVMGRSSSRLLALMTRCRRLPRSRMKNAVTSRRQVQKNRQTEN